MNTKPHYDLTNHHRRSIRLRGYDYTQAGAYFVTICTHHHECLFGDIVRAGPGPAPTTGTTITATPTPTTEKIPDMELNAYGKIIEYTWFDLVNHVDKIELAEFAIMPNHIHGIIVIEETDRIGAGFVRTDHAWTGSVGAGLEPAPTITTVKRHGLPEIVRQFKTFSARRINDLRNSRGTPVWQRNYWEHVIRTEKSYHEIATYILINPVSWEMDQLHP